MSQTTMQQVIITEPGGVDKLAYETVTIPEAKADEVLVKVHAFGINRPDILQRQGLYPMPPGVTQVPGLEVAGEVVAIGAEVTQFKLGDKVCGLTNGGGYAAKWVKPKQGKWCWCMAEPVVLAPRHSCYVKHWALKPLQPLAAMKKYKP